MSDDFLENDYDLIESELNVLNWEKKTPVLQDQVIEVLIKRTKRESNQKIAGTFLFNIFSHLLTEFSSLAINGRSLNHTNNSSYKL